MIHADASMRAMSPSRRPGRRARGAGAWLGVLLAACVPGDASAAWVDQRTVGPFVCRSDFLLDEIEPLLADLQQLQADVMQTLRVPPAQGIIEVQLFAGKEGYDRFLVQSLPRVTYRRALYVKDRGPGRVLACRGPHLATDLRHECTHALLHAALPMVPLWLDEGLAVYFEPPAERRAFYIAHLEPVRRSARMGRMTPLSDLERLRTVEEMDRADYRAAWAWVHFMIHGPSQARRELVGFLADIRAAAPPGSLDRRLRDRLGSPNGLLLAHFDGWPRQPQDSAWPGSSSWGSARADHH